MFHVQGGIMLRRSLALLIFSFSLPCFAKPVMITREMILAKDQTPIASTPTETLETTLTFGMGYHLCPDSPKLPPLDVAYLCSGLAPYLENFIITMKPVKTAKPTWRMWSGSMNFQLKPTFGVTMSYEVLVSFAKVDGENFVFIDGRIFNGQSKNPAYFRITSYGDFAQLDSTHHYGSPVEIKAQSGETILLSPIVVVSKHLPSAGEAKRP